MLKFLFQLLHFGYGLHFGFTIPLSMKSFQSPFLIIVGYFLICATPQIIFEPRLQPWPLNINSLGQCCKSLTLSDHHVSASLIQCVSDSQVSQKSTYASADVKVAIVTYMQPGKGYFAISDILSFGSYQAGVMAAYAETNGYSFRVISGINNVSNFEISDARWNKVKLLSDALDPNFGWAKHVDYIVWIG